MDIFDLLFTGIVRFSLIAFFSLGACLCAARWTRQPLERVRLIQVSFLALLAVVGSSILGAIPTMDLAILPSSRVESVETMAPSVNSSLEFSAEIQLNDQPKQSPETVVSRDATTAVSYTHLTLPTKA